MRLVVLGASGLIGTQLTEDALKRGHEVIGTYAHHPKNGLERFDLLEDRIADLVPNLCPEDSVVVLSAWVDQNKVFKDPVSSRALNVDATIRVMDDSSRCGAHVIFLSSEAVFDGTHEDGYSEDAAPSPLGEYGRQKAEVEEHLFKSDIRGCVARTGWTVGWDRGQACPVANTYRALLAGGARMARDNVFTLTDVRDTVSGLLRVAEQAYLGVLHVAANPAVSRTELADWVIASSAKKDQMMYKTVNFSEIPFSEPRARSAWLRNDKARNTFDMRFSEPYETVVKKVGLLEKWGFQTEGKVS